jgi:hypothetical protein
LAQALFEGRGIAVAAPFPPIVGEEEFARVVARRGEPVLASVVFTRVPGTVLRPLVDPVPLAPVSMVWRRGLRHPGLDALHAAVRSLAATGGWWQRTPGAWLHEVDAALTAR